ncbi:MAG: O-sialoglycoprotein endopeptidase [Peptococcaceae bacterium]|nr:O-sialoglycoprotein endopeptidase [Peptococcaceae bacterium]
MLFLGIDTSAYTSSAAIVDDRKEVTWEYRRLLVVPPGERGLAQSEALFQHIQVLPEIIRMVPSHLWTKMKGVGVSTAPRPVSGSYMPVFTAGMAIASSIASALGVELFHTSHQEGHLAAGIGSAEGFTAEEFLAVHLSGGTTELLKAKKSEPGRFELEILGETSDLHAGQFIDRVGVSLGLSFPAGRELERLAQKAAPGSASLLPSSVKGYEMSFSGVESAVQRFITEKKRPADLARAVEGCIIRTLAKVLEKAVKDTGMEKILIVGGVSSNQYIRTELTRKLSPFSQLFWANPEWSSDNAIGVSMLTRDALFNK